MGHVGNLSMGRAHVTHADGPPSIPRLLGTRRTHGVCTYICDNLDRLCCERFNVDESFALGQMTATSFCAMSKGTCILGRFAALCVIARPRHAADSCTAIQQSFGT